MKNILPKTSRILRVMIYIDRLKMNSAVDMLSSTEKSIFEIAKYLGYKDQFHFSRRFKELKGVPPQAFREDSLLHQ